MPSCALSFATSVGQLEFDHRRANACVEDVGLRRVSDDEGEALTLIRVALPRHEGRAALELSEPHSINQFSVR